MINTNPGVSLGKLCSQCFLLSVALCMAVGSAFAELIDSEPSEAHKYSQWDIYLYDAKNSIEKRLTNTRSNKWNPALSQDEKTLVYIDHDGLAVIDISSGSILRTPEREEYHSTSWVPNRNLISALSSPFRPNTPRDANNCSSLVIFRPDLTIVDTVKIDGYSISLYAWDAAGKKLSLVADSLADSRKELFVLDYGGTAQEGPVYTFDGSITPRSLHWLPGNQLGILGFSPGKENRLFAFDLVTRQLRELYKLVLAESEFDFSFAGALAISGSSPFWERSSREDVQASEVVKVNGADISWVGTSAIVYRSFRPSEEYKEKLRKGIPLPDSRMYLLMEGGGVAGMEDLYDEYSLYVREGTEIQDGKEVPILVNLTLKEAQEYADQHNEGLVLSEDGVKFETMKSDVAK